VVLKPGGDFGTVNIVDVREANGGYTESGLRGEPIMACSGGLAGFAVFWILPDGGGDCDWYGPPVP
jgi:hypothetical protein